MSFLSLAVMSLTSIGIAAQAATRTHLVRRAETTSVPPNFIGYSASSGGWITESCRESSAWQTFSTYGRCCLTARPDCFVATGCESGTVMLGEGGFASTCTGSAAQTSCVTGTVFHSIGDQEPIMNYQCWPQWDGGNWDATVATTTPIPSSTSISTSNSASGTAVSTFLSSSPTPSSSGTTAASSASTTSKAWIAGPVLGGVLGAVLFTLLGVFLYRRRAKKSYQRQQNGLLGATESHPNDQGRADVYAYDRGYTGERMKSGALQGGLVEMDNRGLYEADGGRRVVEADGRNVPVEVDGREVR